MIQVKHEEQYSLLVPGALSGAADFDELERQVTESLEAGRRNFVLNLQGLSDVTDEAVHHFSGLKSIIEKEDGRLVIACPPAQMEGILEENEIVATPTLNEATDYIFMEEIEKQLLEDFGADMDEEE